MSSATSTYLRYPHIRDGFVTFIAADDVWLAPIDGGRAWRITSDHAPVRQPRISPDGSQIAFISHREGHPEVMLADIDTGAVRRLTWWGGTTTTMLGWTGEGSILVASNAGEANSRHAVVKAIDHDGSTRRLPYGLAAGLALHPGGAIALTTPTMRPNAHWKRYRGGTAPRLWLDRTGDGSWQRLLSSDLAPIVDPMWVGESLLFVSDRAAEMPGAADEQANLWVWDTPGQGEPRQLTHQGATEGYVRDATTDGTRVAWHSRGEIWVLDSLQAQPRRVSLTLPGTEVAPRALEPTTNLESIVPDHGGDHSLVTWRGNAFWLAHRQGPARALVADSGIRAREAVVLGRTGQAAMVTDAAGEDSLEIYALDGSAPVRRLLTGLLGRVLHLAADPAGECLAVISHDGAIRLVTLADGSIRHVGRSGQGEAQTPNFSPDGRYLIWSQPTTGEAELHQVMLLDTSRPDAAPIAMTSGHYHDRCPRITLDGKYLVFLSDRTFDPQYDAHAFALAFTGATRPWLIPLTATQPPPFGPALEGWSLSDPPEPSAGPAQPAAVEPVRCPDVDPEGAEDRIVPFPVPSAAYRDLQVAAGGVLWVTVSNEQVLGTHRSGVSQEKTPDRLERWDFAKREVSTLVDQVDHVAVSGDGNRLVVRHQDAVTSCSATHRAEGEQEPVTIDLTRLRLDVNRRAEWRQMFEENARIMRDHFWRSDMDGVDWDAVVARWRPVVEKVRSHDDLVDLLWETVAELNTSHAYVIPASSSEHENRKLGFLGADFARGETGWRIERILPGESSEPEARSPLRAAGVDAREGDVVVAIDGVPVSEVGPAAHLAGSAGQPVELTLRRQGSDRRVVTVPLGSEEELRYQDWVRSRREYVHHRAGGRVGYVHVPDMTSYGWAQLHRDLRQATRAEAVIADVRYNRGGHTSEMVIAKLAARVVGWSVARHYDRPGVYPDQAPRGPVVLVANEFSGSDGDIVTAAAQALEVGPVVGVRTWGGVIGIDGRFDLVDGTTITQPRYAFWLDGQGWAVENYGVDPDIEVVHPPDQVLAEEDPQLDRAIDEAINRLETTPAASPPELPDPKVS